MTRFAALAFALLAPAAVIAGCGDHGTRDTMVVTTQWLAGHLKDPNLVLLSVGPKEEYDKEHIPGALWLNREDFSTPMVMGQLMLELLPAAELAKNFAKYGITNDSRIILYTSKDWISPMTRIYLTFDAMGLGARTSILDGGFPAWKGAGQSASTEVRTPAPGKVDVCPQSDVIALGSWVRDNVRKPGVAIIDARNPPFYSGASAGHNHAGSDQRKGHIPGAASIPFDSMFDAAGKFLPADEWKKRFADAGVKPGDRVVSYCHIGQQATVIYFAARYLGYDARLYDGSWEDWSAHADYPVETK